MGWIGSGVASGVQARGSGRVGAASALTEGAGGEAGEEGEQSGWDLASEQFSATSLEWRGNANEGIG